MKRLFLLLAAALAALLPASAAQAQTAQEAPVKLQLRAVSGLGDGGKLYVIRGQRVDLRGRVVGENLAETVTLTVAGPGNGEAEARASLGRDGAFAAHFTARRTGAYSVRARHAREDEARGTFSPRAVVRSVVPRARRGSSGLSVRLLQTGLRRLAYVTPASGRFDSATGRALIAFRKVNGMSRTASAGSAVYEKLFRGQGGFKLRHPGAGKHVEYDWSRQVLVLARNGRPERIYHSSSGAPATPTVFGTFRFYRKEPGTNSLGMVHSVYFIRGYAIHGYKSVPTYPASHGCLRVPIPDALSISQWIALGDRIDVYR